MPQEVQRNTLRLTCPPCGEVFTADNEDTLVAMAVEHARKLHDINLLEQYEPDEFRALVRRENETYWARIAHLIPDGQVKTVLDEKLCHREREIVSYVVHGFPNREIADRLCISERTVSTHLVNIYEKLNVHSRAELAAIVRAADRIIEAALRGDSEAGVRAIRACERPEVAIGSWRSAARLSASAISVRRHLKQFHVVLFNQLPESIWIRRTCRRLIERRASLGEEHFEPRARKQHQHTGRLVACNYELVRDVLRRVDEVSSMGRDRFVPAGQLNGALPECRMLQLRRGARATARRYRAVRLTRRC